MLESEIEVIRKFLSEENAYKEVWVAFHRIKTALVKAGQTAPNNARDEIIRLLDCMSSDERMKVFGEYCEHCGDKNPRCQCWNNE